MKAHHVYKRRTCVDSLQFYIFQITLTQGQAREITRYSLIAAEDEVLLPPGCRFKVDSVLPQGDLTIIQMTELRSKAWIMDLSAPHEPQPETHSLAQQPPTMLEHGVVASGLREPTAATGNQPIADLQTSLVTHRDENNDRGNEHTRKPVSALTS